MTPAPTMQTRSTLLREYLSAVTCQSTASLPPAGEPPELRVRDEPALPRPRPLDGVEQLRKALLRNVEPEVRDLDPDRVQPALLPEHDPPLRADELGRVRLDRRRIVELGCDRSRLPREEVVPRHGLP